MFNKNTHVLNGSKYLRIKIDVINNEDMSNGNITILFSTVTVCLDTASFRFLDTAFLV